MEMTEILEAIKAVDPKEFTEAFHKGAPNHYQEIFNAGHSTATGEYKSKLETAKEDAKKLQKEIEARDSKLKEVTGNKPDLEALEAKYQKALIDKDNELTEWREKFSQTQDEAAKKFRSLKQSSLVSGVVQKLASEYGLTDAEYAEVKVKSALDGRLNFNDEHDISQILQRDGVTPIPIPKDVDVRDIIAKEIFEDVRKVNPRLIDERRIRSTNIGDPGSPANQRYSEKQIASMSDEEYLKHREQILKAATDNRISA